MVLTLDQETRKLGRMLELVPTPCPPPPEGLPLTQARETLKNVLQKTVMNYLEHGEEKVICIEASVGVGKTENTAKFVAEITDQLLPIPRVLWLAPTVMIRDETAKRYFSKDGGETYSPGVVIAYARARTDGPGYCAKFDEAQTISSRGQSVYQSLCVNCDHLSSCPYLKSKEAESDAHVVFATHERYLHPKAHIDGFDVVIIDEDATDALMDMKTFSLNDIIQWQHRKPFSTTIDLYLNCILEALKQILVTTASNTALNNGNAASKRGTPLLSLLRNRQTSIDFQIDQASGLFDVSWGADSSAKYLDRYRRGEIYDFDTPPISGLEDLIDALAYEVRNNTESGTFCWAFPPSEKKPGYILFIRPRYQLIRSLQQRITLILDATAPRTLHNILFRDQVEFVEVKAQAYQHVTIFADSLYKSSSMQNGSWDREAIQQLINVCLTVV